MGALYSPHTAESHLSSSAWPQALDGGFLLAPARISDHYAIHNLLQSVFRRPSPTEFQLQLDQPGYQADHRLVVHEGPRVVAHARLVMREQLFGDQWLPTAHLFDLCTLPEYRGRRLASHLLVASEQLARSWGAVLLEASTARLSLFQRLGWFSAARQHVHHVIKPRELLAELERRRWERAAQHQPSDDLPQLSSAKHPLTIRRWKQTEHAAIQRLYTQAIVGLQGPIARSDEYWRWLIARQAYDSLYVAIDGPDRTLFDDIQGHIVGYMFLKGSRLVELVASRDCGRAAESLVARACRDAVENNAGPMRLVTPPHESLEALIEESGGKTRTVAEQGELAVCKALDLPRLASATLQGVPAEVRVTFELRQDSATIPMHRDVTESPSRLLVEGNRLTLDTAMARPQVVCGPSVLGELLLQSTTLDEALAAGRLRISSRAVRESLEQIFARRPVWHPVLDNMPS